MKTLSLLRHAKSSWQDSSLIDHERPLNKRGRRTAPRMGAFMAERDLLPDAIISSTACRAKQTVELLTEDCGFSGRVHFVGDLYPSGFSQCLKALREFAGEAKSVLLVGHNPGLEDAVEILTGSFERLPTCALARISLPIDDWEELSEDVVGQLIGTWRPRELFGE